MKKLALLLTALVLSATLSAAIPPDAAYLQSFEKWKSELVDDLKQNWLPLAGLFWHATARWTRRLLEVLAAVVLAQLVITVVMVLATPFVPLTVDVLVRCRPTTMSKVMVPVRGVPTVESREVTVTV